MRKRYTRKRRRTFKGRKRRNGLALRVKRVIRSSQAHKWINSSVVSTSIGASNVNQMLLNLFAPAPGTTRFTRISNQIVIKSVKLRGTVTGGQAVSTPAKVRWIIFIEREPMTTTLTPAILNAGPTIQTGMFSNPDTTGSFSWISLLNPDTVPSRYRVLRDFTITMDVTSALAASNTDQAVYFKRTIKFKKGLKVVFNDSSVGGNPLQINRNCIWVYVSCDQALATGPDVEWEAVTRYSDI